MGNKRQQTMAKMARERSVKERRERKLEKKRERKLAAAAGPDDATLGYEGAGEDSSEGPADGPDAGPDDGSELRLADTEVAAAGATPPKSELLDRPSPFRR